MRTLIKGGLVVDATGRAPIPSGVVALEGGKIAAVGRAADFGEEPGGDRVIEAAGCTVLPGLIDTHVHVLNHARRIKMSEPEAALWARNYLQAPLMAGVTTVRDVGAQHEAIFALRKAVEAGWAVGPRLLVCGSGIAMTGGHGWDTFSVEADGVDGVRQRAREMIKRQVDVVKLMATGGAGTPSEGPTSSQLTLEEMRAAVEEAHKAGLPTAVHATSSIGIKNSLLAGIDSVEHGCHLDDECLELMLRGGAVYSPTLSIYARMAEPGGASVAAGFMVERARGLVGPHRESFQRALAAGVKIVLGTDCGSPWHPMGDEALELELWVQAGMKPLAALEAATRAAAESCRIADQVGTLEPGKGADLLIVEGDATADIAALRRVRLVLRGGATVFDAATPPARPVLGPLPSWVQS